MILDGNLLLSGSVNNGALSGQSIIGTGNILSANTVDQIAQRDIGGCIAEMLFQLTASVVGGTSVEFQVITADDAGLASNVTVVGSSGGIPIASLVLGARLTVSFNPRIGSKGQRYLGARYVIVGTTTAGAVVASMASDYQDNKVYASGFTIA